MAWRVLLTVLYGCAIGALMALDNFTDISDAAMIVVWAMAPVVGILVGRWWALLAIVGILGRAIGWDSGIHDGNPAVWPPVLLGASALLGLPLLAGVAIGQRRESRRELD